MKIFVIVFIFILITYVSAFFILDTFESLGNSSPSTGLEHQTHAAFERSNDFWCYQCNNSIEGESCFNVSSNASSIIKKCSEDEKICMVIQYPYYPEIFSVERMCTSTCNPGCYEIGEVTKAYACITCCDKSLCNTGTGTANDLTMKEINFVFALILQIILTVYSP
ncbi:uncharacterized protein LOC124424441 [Vespa crabro]|uniref:uncharacterized protein LOC124424441 n=1 Tax=Vespa crabro TaxID=7445 RepID=UPI001F00E070|nr:uncharacterized protein LOC124424441 [Vespa crabro]